ncbi:hypothetical protein [Gemmatimonas sp.]
MATLADALAAALGPVVTALADQLGVTLAIYRPVVASLADGTPTRTYPVADPAWANAAGFLAMGSASGPGSDALTKPFGVRTTAFATLTLTRNAAGELPTLSPFDGVVILSGPYAGYTWLVEADHVPDAIGVTAGVRLVSAPAGTIPSGVIP